jgi:hypothetical protein
MALLGATLAPTVSACSSASVIEIYTSLDAEGGRRRKEFFTDSIGLYCVSEIASGRDDQTVEMFLRQIADQNGARVDRILLATEGPTSKGATRQKVSLQLQGVDEKGEPSDEAPLPAGRFRCEVKIDGNSGGTTEFVINYAPCPASQIFPNSACGGFVKPGTNCPRYGVGAGDPARCTCGQSNKWDCP